MGCSYATRESSASAIKDENDIWRERSTGSANRSEARQVKKQFLKDLEEGTIPTPFAKLSVSIAADQWLESYRSHILRKTQRSYKTCLTPIKSYFGDRRLRSITSADLLAYQTKRIDAGLHPTTVNHEVMTFSFPLTVANLWKRLKYKPLPTDKLHSSRQSLTNAELNQLLLPTPQPDHVKLQV
jgi:hypothetical protein